MDNDSMLWFVQHFLGKTPWITHNGHSTYVRLAEIDDEFKALSENRALLERLEVLLQLDYDYARHVAPNRTIHNFVKWIPGFGGIKFQHDHKAEEIAEARKKAYEDYEFLRRLSFETDKGLIFIIELR